MNENVSMFTPETVWTCGAAFLPRAPTVNLSAIQLSIETYHEHTSFFRISRDDNCNVPFPGRIDDARIYNRALTSVEVAYVFSGKPWLNLSRTNDQLTLSWLAPGDGWVLESTNTLPMETGVSWPQVPPPYLTNSGAYFVVVTNTPVAGNRFYRLHKP